MHVSFKFCGAFLLGAACFLAGLNVAPAASVPAGFTESLVPGPNGGNWTKAVGTTFDATGRMFVWELGGRVWVKGETETNFTLLLNIGEEIAGEGLLGFALDPNFLVNGHIYLLYTVDRHYLLNFGTTNYDPNFTDDNKATVGRVTRYTCVAANDFKSLEPASRFILIGDSKTNGIPICGVTHNVGSLVFGEDGTLLISTGDTASFYDVDTGGAIGGANVGQALADGILKPKEDVGGYRSQLVDSLSGKILRIDPATGDGLPSNPFYDATKPRAPKSRVWALGLRNPFRMTLRPGSGDHNPADGKPGVLYVGEVGWDSKEALKVVTGPGQNFGWPLYEGLDLTPNRGSQTYNLDVANQDAPNPLYPGSGCSQYFSFRQLFKQETTNVAGMPPFNNPCNAAVKIPSSIPQFLFHRPALDWDHYSASTRTPTFNVSGNATIADVGASGSPVSGTQFRGNCSVGGAWYTGTGFPEAYRNKYFHSDWGAEVIKLLTFGTNNQPVAVADFANVGPVVCIVQHPEDGSLYYVVFDGQISTVRRLVYTGNRTPVAVAAANQYYGTSPLTVQFSSAGSGDPDEQSITYAWNFGDGTAVSTLPNPAHVFSVPGGSVRTNYTVTLTVTDSGGLSANAALNIALNDTPPTVSIITPTNATLVSLASNTLIVLTALVSDAESSDSQLQYSWQTLLHHNDHNHVLATSTNHVSSTVLEPVGCDGINIYYYRVLLTVTDPNGLATTRETDLFANCGTTDTPPTISDIADQNTIVGVATVPIPFTIADAEVAAANLQLRASASDPVLVPTNNIVFGGFGANRTVAVTPAASFSGTATITVTVNDGPHDVSDVFLLTVGGSNTPPGISSLMNQTTAEGTPTVTNGFTISDANTAPGSLMLSGWAANPSLVPANNFIFGGSGSNRTVSVIPAPGQTGTTTITVAVSDGQLSASNSFTLTVTGSPPGTRSFTNTTAINVPDVSVASPYPSTINVFGLGGAVSNVTVTLRSLNYQWGRDLDVLLVSPSGQAMIVMSDAGTGPTAANANLSFADNAPGFLNQSNALVSGTYRPTDYPSADTFLTPAPAGPYATNLAIFNGHGANGTWSLYALDDGPTDTGSISGGWSLTIATQAVPSSNTPPTISGISNQVTLVNTATPAIPFTVTDAETAASNLTVTVFSSAPLLMPTNNVVLGGSGTNRTIVLTPVSNLLGSANVTLSASDGALSVSDSFTVTVSPALLTVTANSFSRAYGSTNAPLTGSLIGGQVGDEIGANFSTAANTNSPVGSYPILVTLSDPHGKLSNYLVTTNHGTLTVTNSMLLVLAGSTNKTYGTMLNPTMFEASGLLNSDTVTNVVLVSAGSTSNANTGSYDIIANDATGVGLANYTVGYSNGVLLVSPAELLVTADNKSRIYGQPNPEFTMSFAGFMNGDGTNVLNLLPVAGAIATNTSAPGDYTITLTGGADDNYALSLSNGVLTVTAPGPVTIVSAEFLDADHLQLRVAGDAQVRYVIQSSSDLREWSDAGTATADNSGAFEYIDATTTGSSMRFYRIALP